MHAVYCKFTLYFDFYPKIWRRLGTEMTWLDLKWPSRDYVDLTAATLRSNLYKATAKVWGLGFFGTRCRKANESLLQYRSHICKHIWKCRSQHLYRLCTCFILLKMYGLEVNCAIIWRYTSCPSCNETVTSSWNL